MKQIFLIMITLLMVGCNEAKQNENNPELEMEMVVPVDVSATIITDYSKVKLTVLPK